jgi:hypothetical protein
VLAATIRVDSVGDIADDDLAEFARDAERMVRAAEAYRVELLGEIERRGLHAHTGHRDIAEYARGVHRMTPRESRDTKRLARLIRAHPSVGERLSLGVLGVAQARLLASAFAHPRAGSKLADFLPMFFGYAASHDFVEFEAFVRAWRSRADEDGADPEKSHKRRSVTVSRSDTFFRMRMNGPAIDAAEIDAVLQKLIDAEYEKDRAWVTEHHGPDAPDSLLPRTAAQRRYDALLAAILGAGAPDAVVNLVATPDMLAAGLAQLFPDSVHPDLPDPVPGESRCETVGGDPISPADLALAAIRGRVRFVLTDHRRVVLEMGYRIRLFRGAARDAVLLQATRCTQPGCLVRHTEADHLLPASARGPTDVCNGGPRCGCHNRWRQRAGASSTLDDEGRWVTQLPDGTDIAPPDDIDFH